MQSFASPPHPFPIPNNPQQSPTPPQKSRTTNSRTTIHATPPQKGRNYHLYPRPFHPKNHRKGATIAHTNALSTQKSIERAQLSLIPTPFLPKNPQKGRNYRLYPRPFYQKIHRKGATIASPQEKFVTICANSWLKTTNTDSANHTDFPLNPYNNFNHKFPQISTNNSSSNPLKIR